MARIRFRLLLALAALLVWLPADAQLRRGARTVVSGGIIYLAVGISLNPIMLISFGMDIPSSYAAL